MKIWAKGSVAGFKIQPLGLILSHLSPITTYVPKNHFNTTDTPTHKYLK